MINFTKQELKWIKEQMQVVLDIWNNGSKEDLKQFISEVSGEMLDIVLQFSGHDWRFFDDINKDEYFNKKAKDFCYDGCGMWVWQENEFDEARDVFEYIPDHIYCQIYEKILKNDEEDIEDTEAAEKAHSFINFDMLNGKQKEVAFMDKDFKKNSYITEQGTIFVNGDFIGKLEY